MPGSRELAENRARTSKQLEMGNTGEEDRLGGRGGAGGCWKMAEGARTRPGGVPHSTRGMCVMVSARGPRHAGRMAGTQGQDQGGMPLPPAGRDTGTGARCRRLRRAGRGSQA